MQWMLVPVPVAHSPRVTTTSAGASSTLYADLGQYVVVGWLFLVSCAGLGLLVGSFLNVMIDRTPWGQAVVPAKPECQQCSSRVPISNRVPVGSWLLSRVRCADCGTSSPARYPMVVASTALLFVVVGLRFGLDWELPAFLYLAVISIALTVIDLDVKRLPNKIVLPSYIVGGLLLLMPAIANGMWPEYRTAWLGALALFVIYFALAWIYPAGMGYGDVKLAGVLGLYLGWLGWEIVVVGTFIGFLSGALVGLFLMIFGSAGRQTRIPFGPSMLFGAWIAIIWGPAIAEWYSRFALPA